MRARVLERFGAYCWFVAVDYEDGSLGHLDLQIPVRGDFQEGFQVFGEHGSVNGRVYLPWFTSRATWNASRRGIGSSIASSARTPTPINRQIEGFAATILDGLPQIGANLDDGLAAMQAMVAIARSAETGDLVRLNDVNGGV